MCDNCSWQVYLTLVQKMRGDPLNEQIQHFLGAIELAIASNRHATDMMIDELNRVVQENVASG